MSSSSAASNIAKPSTHLRINPSLKCGEEYLPDVIFSATNTDEDVDNAHVESYDDDYDDDDGDEYYFNFHITLPSSSLSSNECTSDDEATLLIPAPVQQQHRLNFYTRDRSTGTGVLITAPPSNASTDAIIVEQTTHPETSNNGPSDPFFFEKGFYLEAKTGFQVWPGSRFMVEVFTCALPDAAGGKFGRLRHWQERLQQTPAHNNGNGLNILEVGAGMGVVGTCLASAGGNVLMTDLPILVEHGIYPNLRRNRTRGVEMEGGATPSFLDMRKTTEQISNSSTFTAAPIKIGKGYSHLTTLDWFQPLSAQLSIETTSLIDVIIACDCIFLRKLVEPLLDTISSIFDLTSTSTDDGVKEEVSCLFTYQSRNLRGVFIPLEELLDRIVIRGWNVDCLAWRTVFVEGDGEHPLFLFEISRGFDEGISNVVVEDTVVGVESVVA